MQVNEEKATLENRLTTEQEYLDNQLQKKVCMQCFHVLLSNLIYQRISM